MAEAQVSSLLLMIILRVLWTLKKNSELSVLKYKYDPIVSSVRVLMGVEFADY